MPRKLWVVVTLVAVAMPVRCHAVGRGGGGFRGGGGGGGVGGRVGGMQAPRPNVGGAMPGGGMRPGGGSMPSVRPQVPAGGIPSLSRPAVTPRPAPEGPRVGVPTLGGSGGLKPATRPSVGGGPSIQRPPSVSRPATPQLPNVGTRPSVPNLGGGMAGNRLPGTPGGAARPNPGDLGDFLGLDRPVTLPGTTPGVVQRPAERPATLPGRVPGVERPGERPVTLPGGPSVQRPGIQQPGIQRPGVQRPGDGPFVGGPGVGDRLGNSPRIGDIRIGDVNVGNRVINNRVSWANIDANRINALHGRWQSQLGGLRDWPRLHPNRIGYWNGWADGVRTHWGYYHRPGPWFNGAWWAGHHHGLCGWHYGHVFPRYGWTYWWGVPTYPGLVGWFTWSAQYPAWSQPVYYDYGTGGNVVYQDNSVYVNNQPVATADEFAQSAAALATVAPPANEAAAAAAEWMPLGTFALTTDAQDQQPTRVVQLAVNKEGIISGTLYNTATDQAQTIQGQVDRQTQRVAFRIGESDQVVAETGLYNLTQDEAPLLVHWGSQRTETYLLVRLPQPEEGAEGAGELAL